MDQYRFGTRRLLRLASRVRPRRVRPTASSAASSSARTLRASASSRSRSAAAALRDGSGLRVRLVDDEAGLALGLVLELVRGPLGRDERRAQQRLQLAVAGELGLELLDPVGEVGALAPDLLERLGDLLDQAVDGLRR